jgi:hypothetical protein
MKIKYNDHEIKLHGNWIKAFAHLLTTLKFDETAVVRMGNDSREYYYSTDKNGLYVLDYRVL